MASAETASSAVEGEPQEEKAAAPPARPKTPAWLPLAIAIAAPVLFFFFLPPLTKSGLWDPHELNVADFARRIAVNLHGATNLALESADNSLPHLNDLGRPQLPFTSIALGFSFFGLHEWAGRAPLALWGVIGVLATYAFVARLVDRRAAVMSALVLTTMPLFFVQARTMLGDIVTMASFAMAFGGFAACAFGRREEETKGRAVTWGVLAPLLLLLGPIAAVGLAATTGTRDQKKRLLFFTMGWLGLAAGMMSRGFLIGLAVPALGVGLSYLVLVANGQREKLDDLGHTVGILALVAGLADASCALVVAAKPPSDTTVLVLGALLRTPVKYPTYEMTIGHLALALAPWSAFAPFAFGRMFVVPRGEDSAAQTRESHTRVVVVVGASVAFVAHGWIAARTDLIAFSAPSVIAVACGIALRDYERKAHPSIAIGVGAFVLAFLIRHEVKHWPEKAFQAFAVNVTVFPETFKAYAFLAWLAILVIFGVAVFLTWVELEAERTPFDPRGYVRVLVALRDAWDGMLALIYFALVAGASLAGLAVWLGTRYHAKWLPQLSSQMREYVLDAWWVIAFVPLGIVFGIYFLCDLWLWAFHRAPEYGKGALTRGFEPFEELAAKIKNARLGTALPNLIIGRLKVTAEETEEGEGLIALFVLAPLMYLLVPLVVFVVLAKPGKLIGGVPGAETVTGLRTLVAGALAIPSGVALFLVLGVFGVLARRWGRPSFVAVVAIVVGVISCGFYYPALANQLSPKEVFESYQRVAKSGEPLALFGVGSRTVAYYAGGQPLTLRDTSSAYDWLMGGPPGARRFLAVRSEELARLNNAYRQRTQTGENLPVLDARSSQIILVTSTLRDGEANQNPLSKIVLTTKVKSSQPSEDLAPVGSSSSPANIALPKPQRKLEVTLDEKLQVLGIDLLDANGRPIDHFSPGKKYHMRTYFKVLAPIQGEWQMFIHIDGFHRRHNGDHQILEGKYPMGLWLPNDVVMDDHEFTLEPNFSQGPYTIYFGLFAGEARMHAKGSNADTDNRVNAGVLRVH